MIIFGLLGFAMLRLNVPAAPFLIAVVLGPLLEDNFRQSLLLSDGDPSIFFRSAICIVFWILTFTTITFLISNHLKTRKKS
jgi:putative tricarboxylic transport membrane protein